MELPLGSGAPSHWHHRGVLHLVAVMVSLTHDLGHIAQQLLYVPATRERRSRCERTHHPGTVGTITCGWISPSPA